MSTIVSAIENDSLLTLRMLVAVPGIVPMKELNYGLMHAVKTGSLEATEVLIQAAADVNMADSRGMTPLMQAAQSGHHSLVSTLIQAGSSLSASSACGYTALHLGCIHGRSGVVETLVLAGANVNRRDHMQRTPLIVCAASRHTQCMKYLLAAGCDLDLKDTGGHTALHHACQKAVGVDLLLNAGADPDCIDVDGNTPLMVAATEGFDNVVKSLVEHSCNPDIKNSFGIAPIHYLSMKNHWRGIQYIADIHGDLNPLDKEFKLPLWHAVNHNRHHAVKTLLRANCAVDPPITNESEDNIPLKTALNRGLYGLAKLLVLAGCKLNALYQWIDNYDSQKQRRAEERSQRVHLFVDSDEDSDSDEDWQEADAYNWFQEWIHSAHSLRQLCRINLRRYMGRGLLNKADDLPIPQQIRDYVTLREVEDYHHVPDK